jgi:hypothetical protein
MDDYPVDTEGLDGQLVEYKEDVGPAPIPPPTGLSDEDDARAYLAQRFNGLFCPNCEYYWNREDTHSFKHTPDSEIVNVCPGSECRAMGIPLQEFGQERAYRYKYGGMDTPSEGRRHNYNRIREISMDPVDLGALMGMPAIGRVRSK